MSSQRGAGCSETIGSVPRPRANFFAPWMAWLFALPKIFRREYCLAPSFVFYVRLLRMWANPGGISANISGFSTVLAGKLPVSATWRKKNLFRERFQPL
ncbi:MAG: hypothetical protein KAR11_07380 [Phycisphaerae bacterium]|nr:hypothetical protein [Phycisphaerae bacterium]